MVTFSPSSGFGTYTLLSNNGGLTWWAARLDRNTIQGPRVAMSSDGMRAMAMSSTRFSLSLDGGSTWQQITHDAKNFPLALVASSDGLRLAAYFGGDSSIVLTSDNGGLSWRKQIPGPSIYGMISSADGKTLMVRVPSSTMTSKNSGESWNQRPDLGAINMFIYNENGGMAASANGQTLVAASGNKTYISTDDPSSTMVYELGTPTGGDPHETRFVFLASSSDASQLAAIVDMRTGTTSAFPKRHIYTSPDFGRTWTRRAFTNVELDRLTISNDGSRLTATVYSMYSRYGFYTSTDGGATWDPPLP